MVPGKKASEEERREQILDAAFRVATREGLEGMTVRRVAAEAGLSSGLVFFHFGTKEALMFALLDRLVGWLLQLPGLRDLDPTAPARERFAGLLRKETEHDGEDLAWTGLFYEFWVVGTRHREMREKMRAAVERYEDAFLPLARGVLEEAGRPSGATPEGLASAAASFVVGSALRSALDRERFDVGPGLAAMDALLSGTLDSVAPSSHSDGA